MVGGFWGEGVWRDFWFIAGEMGMNTKTVSSSLVGSGAGVDMWF